MSIVAAKTTDARGGKIPSPLEVALIWVTTGVVMIAVSTGFAFMATEIAKASGVPMSVLKDPELSPVLTHPLWVAGGTLAVELSLLGVVGAWIWVLKPSLAQVLPIRAPAARELLGALLLVFGVMPLASASAEVVYRLVGDELTASDLVGITAPRASLGELAALIHALAFAPALAEEAMFRGLITGAFVSRSRALAVLLPSAMFGLFHLEPTQAAGTMVLGISFGLTRVYTGSIVPCAVAHCLYNAVIVLMMRHNPVIEHTIRIWPIFVGLSVSALGFVILRRGGLPCYRTA
ncbi:MAG TPA: type II CAAX endopeptidase family protein [Polyangiaceae bacterium]